MAAAPSAFNSSNSRDGLHSTLHVRVHVWMAQGSLRHMQSAAGKSPTQLVSSGGSGSPCS